MPRKIPVTLIWTGFKTLNLRLWKTMCREPPPVKHHTRERPTNLPRQRDLVFELPASGDRRTKSQCMCIPWFLHVRPALAVFPPWRSFIMPSHTLLVCLCCTAAPWNWHRGCCIISWFFYAQNTSSALTSSHSFILSPLNWFTVNHQDRTTYIRFMFTK